MSPNFMVTPLVNVNLKSCASFAVSKGDNIGINKSRITAVKKSDITVPRYIANAESKSNS